MKEAADVKLGRPASSKKNAVREDCVKSTPKEEGGGDTAWIDPADFDPTGNNYPERLGPDQAFFVRRTTNVLICP